MNTLDNLILRIKLLIKQYNEEIWNEDFDYCYDYSIEVENVNNLSGNQYVKKILNDFKLDEYKVELFDDNIIQITKGEQWNYWEIEIFETDSTNKDNFNFIEIGVREIL